MLKAGANCFRLNFAHGTHEERKRQIGWIRKASEAHGKPVAILMDLAGPKMRFGELHGKITLRQGDLIELKHDSDEEGVLSTQYDLSKKVKKGEPIIFNDGRVTGEIMGVSGGIVTVKVTRAGWISSRKGIHLPETDLEGDILSDKDMVDLRFGATQDIDYVGLSFVQTPDDIEKLRQTLKACKFDAQIMVKIETKKAVEYLDSIVLVSDAVCVARGDLAVETSPESVPVAQRRIIDLCRRYGKISIVATQMLLSMVDHPDPTRAEVSDVATAAILGADAVWLSDETAKGQYPLQAVQYMDRIVRYSEQHLPVQPLFTETDDRTIQTAISAGILTLAHQVGAAAIVAETKTGATAAAIATLRPQMPVIAVTSSLKTAQQLTIRYGVKTFVRPDDKNAATKLTDWLRKTKILKKDDVIVIAAGKYPGTPGSTDTIKVRKIS